MLLGTEIKSVREDGAETDLDLGHYERSGSSRRNLNYNLVKVNVNMFPAKRFMFGGGSFFSRLNTATKVIPLFLLEIKRF